MHCMKIMLCFATVLLAACAGNPPPSTDARVIEPVPAHEPTDAEAQSAADRRFAEETRGYKLLERNGQKYYCRSERPSGSNLRTMNCFTENELRTRVENAEAYRKRSKPSLCAPNDPRCGGA
jgi:hypothetical protein